MEPDDFLCSRNARPKKALVGRAQWKIIQPPSLKREPASLEGSLRRVKGVYARNGRSSRPLLEISKSVSGEHRWVK
jgi:hypothetical protein